MRTCPFAMARRSEDTDKQNGKCSPRAAGGPVDQRVYAAAEAAAQQDADAQLDAALYSTDDFRMFCFKVMNCNRKYSHDWTQCPFAHPGEKAKRRDPQQYKYAAIACIDMKKNGTCPRGDSCPYAHNVFEYWMHPTRYRTQICNDGANCNRTICFFAHSLDELRVPPHKPGFPPEWRNRRHGRSNSSGSVNSSSSCADRRQASQGKSQSPLSRALSVPVTMPADRLDNNNNNNKMQMSDGSWGSPMATGQVLRVKSGPPTLTDIFGAPASAYSPNQIWSGGVGVGSLSSAAGPWSGPNSIESAQTVQNHRGSIDSAPSLPAEPISESDLNPDVTNMIYQLIGSISKSRNSMTSSEMAPDSLLGMNQMSAAPIVRKMLNRAKPAVDTSGDDGWGMAGADSLLFACGIPESEVIEPRSSGQFAPFPMMERQVEIPLKADADGSVENGNFENDTLSGPDESYAIASQISGLLL